MHPTKGRVGTVPSPGSSRCRHMPEHMRELVLTRVCVRDAVGPKRPRGRSAGPSQPPDLPSY
eukprot:1188654-Prorocentrum_minimum.AAC.2